ncbi:hypothetical protein QUF79_03220 [Fictibacillus enclensis]|uniref:hypothetical protein n=1 Tax=Fictibacillus enclensis TaxID=1017270 RepID=UPI0025A0EF1C|nr:hypothetical protein [Fictibacillus enclensis]MDM5197043.1 hypothetical protein [Fictibacillus enclensis]
MYIRTSITELDFLKEHNMVIPISRWETLEKAEAYYSRMDGNYTAGEEDVKKQKSAYSTPFRVYMINKCCQSSQTP